MRYRQGYCYALHKSTLVEIDPSAAHTLAAIATPGQLRGIKGGVFFAMDNHPADIPNSILMAAERAGMIWVTVNDEWERERDGRPMLGAEGDAS